MMFKLVVCFDKTKTNPSLRFDEWLAIELYNDGFNIP